MSKRKRPPSSNPTTADPAELEPELEAEVASSPVVVTVEDVEQGVHRIAIPAESLVAAQATIEFTGASGGLPTVSVPEETPAQRLQARAAEQIGRAHV